MRSGSCHAVDVHEVLSRIENPDSGHQFMVGIDALEQRLIMRTQLSSEPEQCSCFVDRHEALFPCRCDGDDLSPALEQSS